MLHTLEGMRCARSRRKAGTAHNTAGSLPQSGEPEPRRPAPRRARAWQAAGYFLSGPTQPPALKPSSPAGSWMTQRDVLAHDDLSHFGSAPRCSSGNQTLAARPASPPCLSEQPASFADPPGVILDGFHEVFVDGHGLPAAPPRCRHVPRPQPRTAARSGSSPLRSPAMGAKKKSTNPSRMRCRTRHRASKARDALQ